ncbi:MAG: heme exporter protein CcmD [Erythrobacter sp.]
MREGLAQWDYVMAAYALGLVVLAALTIWAWRSMRSAEARRDKTRRR